MLAVALTGCAAKKPLTLAHKQHIQFQGVRNGQCTVKDVQLDAKTGDQIVVCEGDPK